MATEKTAEPRIPTHVYEYVEDNALAEVADGATRISVLRERLGGPLTDEEFEETKNALLAIRILDPTCPY